MIDMDLATVAHAVGGTLTDCPDPGLQVTGVVADSRHVTPGDLYVAIVGERSDGHDFAGSAQAAGAVATLGARATGFPTIVVDDPVEALGCLATYTLTQIPQAKVVAITGSSGKTTTKDLIAGLLSDIGPTVAPVGSLNTEVGLPLTVLRATAQTRFMVLEMGSRGLGHIAELTAIAAPDISVVLNVGTAHLGEFGGREAIAAAKSEIVAALTPKGVAILNGDDRLVAGMVAATAARVVRFGTSAVCEIRATDLVLDAAARPAFTIVTDVGSALIQMRMHGEHMIANACAAAAVALECGMSLERVAHLLSTAQARSAMRMDVRRSPAGITVINDAYNANPESMRAALKTLAAMAGGGRTFAVLGEMRELGEASIAEHDEIGRLAVRLDISKVIAVGAGARPLHLGAAQEGSWSQESVWVPDVAGALEVLGREAKAGDVVLIKASRSIGLESVAEALLAGTQSVLGTGSQGQANS